MLVELEIRDFALIENARVEFSTGLNVLTGETGVGKSLLLHALTFALGEKATSSYLRAGASETEVTALFRLPSRDVARAVEEATGIPGGDEAEVLLRRTFNAAGQSRAYQNGRPVTVALLKAVGEILLDIHGQHEHQSLLQAGPQLLVLDRFGAIEGDRAAYATEWRAREEKRRLRAELAAGEATRRERLELVRANLEEIRAAAPQPGEGDALEREKKLLAHGEKIATAVRAAYQALYEADGSASERLHLAQGELERAAAMDGELTRAVEVLGDAATGVRDVAGRLERYIDGLQFNPRRREEVEDRLYLLRRLQARFGPSLDAVLHHAEDLVREGAELAGAEDHRTRLEAEIAETEGRLRRAGEALSKRRRSAARTLERAITRGLADLALGEAKFTIEFEPAAADGAEGVGGSSNGPERVEFCIAANPGEPPKPLRKIASGGELSRTMLAIKKVLAESDRIPVLVFDEIDANVGGRLGSVLARELRSIARTHQVLCVTHMPQIAAAAHRHLRVAKEVSGGRTQTSFAALDGRARVLEIGEMIEGRPPSPTSISEAELLLRNLGGDDKPATTGGTASRKGGRKKGGSPALEGGR